MEDIRAEQDAALERAKDAVASALAGSGGSAPAAKRPAADATAAAAPATKRRRANKRPFGVDDGLSSDSEDDDGARSSLVPCKDIHLKEAICLDPCQWSCAVVGCFRGLDQCSMLATEISMRTAEEPAALSTGPLVTVRTRMVCAPLTCHVTDSNQRF